MKIVNGMKIKTKVKIKKVLTMSCISIIQNPNAVKIEKLKFVSIVILEGDLTPKKETVS